MNYLVDTHVFLWTLINPIKISKSVKGILTNPELVKFVSVVTFWEISLKYSLGKIDLKGVLPEELPVIAKETGFEILNLEAEIASSFHQLLKIKHKDPFDRMLSWQAICEDCTLLTYDKEFASYRDEGLKIQPV